MQGLNLCVLIRNLLGKINKRYECVTVKVCIYIYYIHIYIYIYIL